VPTASARSADRVFSPLDERLTLLPRSTFSPRVHQCLVRLGTELPFERVPAVAKLLLGVIVSVDTVRRLTEAAGVAQVDREAATRDRIRRTAPDGPTGPAVQQLSADGAMVPVTGGDWVEVRTLVLGTVDTEAIDGPHTRDVRYFSRLCSAAAFIDWVDLPLHEAGTATAGTVVAVQDGADWLMQLLDAHRPDAVRILDFPHAAEYLTRAAQAAFGPGTRETSAWLDTWLHELKHGDPGAVIAALRALPTTSEEATAVRDGAAAYLTRRRRQIAYGAFRAQGYPIGSGVVESANKLLVEERLKGAGMHWSRQNVTPMLALRAVVCNGEWEMVWPALWDALSTRACEQARQRWLARREARRAQAEHDAPLPAPPAPVLPKDPIMNVDGRPTLDHHWKHGYDQRLLSHARR
jgi:hypothetical protein